MDEKSKKLFEKWAYENGYNVDKTETGSIISYQTNIASCVWQAATKQAALERLFDRY